jgi:hypothetical protein
MQTCQTGGQSYSDTSPFSIPCLQSSIVLLELSIMFLDSSIRLLDNLFSTSFAHEDHYLIIIIGITVKFCNRSFLISNALLPSFDYHLLFNQRFNLL